MSSLTANKTGVLESYFKIKCPFLAKGHESNAATLLTEILYFEILRESYLQQPIQISRNI